MTQLFANEKKKLVNNIDYSLTECGLFTCVAISVIRKVAYFIFIQSGAMSPLMCLMLLIETTPQNKFLLILTDIQLLDF